ncbi:MAG TPA: prenyltransferase/squalene oxidase repeat-containing protein [Planctomycetota bacterium]|nr:prenyltransferase/squalene oxidase repeat-containing protein [Planctomycetota bacterium]
MHLAFVLLMAFQEVLPPPEADIERAIKSGTQALIARWPGVLSGEGAPTYGAGYEYDALILYTLVHSGISLQEETVQRLLGRVLAAPLHRNYQVALTAAALSAIDPVKHQVKLAQCAQYLVDWQCDNGQWGYGDKYEPEAVAAAPGAGANQTIAKIKVKRVKKLGPASGDNSNSQYAALGLRACSVGGCEIDAPTLNRAIEWWEKSQQKDGGWSYHRNGIDEEKFGTYGSMTAGAVSSLIMLKQLKRADHKNASSVTRGLAWMASNFTVEKNPDQPAGLEDWRYYFLYAMERAGDLYPTEKFGKHAWYAIGAAHLLKTQRSDGTWIASNSKMTIADTCFALLFLERVARRAPVATGGKESK